MNTRRRFQLTGAVLVCAVVVSAYCSYQPTLAEDARPIPTDPVHDSIRGTMQHKIAHSQVVLNGLVTRDFTMMGKAASELKKVSLNDPQQIDGDQIDKELYEHFRLEFLRTCTLIERMSKEENLEGAAFAYQSLTANCLACHSYLDQDSQKIRPLIR